MIRNIGGFLLVLPAAAVLFAGPAEAQLFGSRSSSTPAPAVTEEQLPPPSFGTETRYDDRGMPGRYAPAPQAAPMPLYDAAATGVTLTTKQQRRQRRRRRAAAAGPARAGRPRRGPAGRRGGRRGEPA